MSPGEIAGWLAPVATMIAAIMTASNLGARITGWGFVVFAVGSTAWMVVAIATDQPNLLWTNGFLLLVNMIGIWRWLGRQARYEQGGQAAVAESLVAPAPTLIPVGSLSNCRLVGKDGAQVGTVVEAMMRCDTRALSYVVISEGGVGGIGEQLHALPAEDFILGPDAVTTRLTAAEIAALPALEDGKWPVTFAKR